MKIQKKYEKLTYNTHKNISLQGMNQFCTSKEIGDTAENRDSCFTIPLVGILCVYVDIGYTNVQLYILFVCTLCVENNCEELFLCKHLFCVRAYSAWEVEPGTVVNCRSGMSYSICFTTRICGCAYCQLLHMLVDDTVIQSWDLITVLLEYEDCGVIATISAWRFIQQVFRC